MTIAGVFQQQLVHVRNECVSNDPDHLPYVRVGSINFHSTGHHLDHYQSLHGTSKVEAVHSVLDRTFYSTHGICTEVFDARLGWWLLGYNRRQLRGLGKKVPPDVLPPKVSFSRKIYYFYSSSLSIFRFCWNLYSVVHLVAAPSHPICIYPVLGANAEHCGAS